MTAVLFAVAILMLIGAAVMVSKARWMMTRTNAGMALLRNALRTQIAYPCHYEIVLSPLINGPNDWSWKIVDPYFEIRVYLDELSGKPVNRDGSRTRPYAIGFAKTKQHAYADATQWCLDKDPQMSLVVAT